MFLSPLGLPGINFHNKTATNIRKNNRQEHKREGKSCQNKQGKEKGRSTEKTQQEKTKIKVTEFNGSCLEHTK